jgi:hypothetical protein
MYLLDDKLKLIIQKCPEGFKWVMICKQGHQLDLILNESGSIELVPLMECHGWAEV